MTSVGEVMAIGRTFEEAIQKASRMVSGGVSEGLDGGLPAGMQLSDLDELLRVPTDKRLWAVQFAFENGYSIEEVHRLSRIDCWFLSKLKRIAVMKAETLRCR
jgi:carbamoyl-phosphate synthase large subunit